jgi:hypothetical protein
MASLRRRCYPWESRLPGPGERAVKGTRVKGRGCCGEGEHSRCRLGPAQLTQAPCAQLTQAPRPHRGLDRVSTLISTATLGMRDKAPMVIPPASEGGRTTLSVVVLLSVYTDNHFFGEFAMLRMAGTPPPQTLNDAPCPPFTSHGASLAMLRVAGVPPPQTQPSHQQILERGDPDRMILALDLPLVERDA